MKVKAHTLYVAGSITAVVLSLGVAGLAVLEKNRQAGTKDFFSAKRNELGDLYALPEFPSTGNVKGVEKNQALLDREVTRLSEAMGSHQVDPQQKKPLEWMSMLTGMRDKLRAKANVNEIVVAEEFMFGFERYADFEPPPRQNVPRLAQQLVLIEMLCNLLYDGGITQLDKIKRDVFEDRALGPAEIKTTYATDVALPEPTSEEKFETIYSVEHLTMKFCAKEQDFVGILNGLSSNSLFIVVTGVKYKGESGIDMTEAEARPTRFSAGENDQDLGEEEDRGPVDYDWQDKVVSGRKREVPAEIELDMDVYWFRRAARGENEGTTKKD